MAPTDREHTQATSSERVSGVRKSSSCEHSTNFPADLLGEWYLVAGSQRYLCGGDIAAGRCVDQVNAMLLNEFLKAHHKLEEQDRKNDEQKATIAELKTAVASLTTAFHNQAAELQQVKAEVQTSKAAPQLATNKR